jgi:hypothetical protein
LKEGQTYFRWCFSDLITARAFMEQFDGKTYKQRPTRTAKSLTHDEASTQNVVLI